MRPWLSIRTHFVVLFAVLCAGGFSVWQSNAQPMVPETNSFPLSDATVEGATVRTMSQGGIRWNTEEFSIEEGIHVLMRVIMDSETRPETRAKALDQLGHHARELGKTERIPKLVALYDELQGRDERGGVLLCLMNTRDPRGIPLFAKVLEREKDNVLRLLASAALARWNIRRGVEGLIQGLKCSEVVQDRTIQGEAMGLFLSLSARKGWGFPEREVRTNLGKEFDLAPKQLTTMWVERVGSWFDANKARFPDWKPGDPLPEAHKDIGKPHAEK